MGTNTPNLGLYKPTRGELGWDDEINANFDTLDTEVGRIESAWENVKAYGAIGDGTTDDTVAIQAAITAAPTGGTVYFPATANGYKLTSTIQVSKALTLKGDQTRVTQTGTGQKGFAITASGVTVDGFYMVGRQFGTANNTERAVDAQGTSWASKLTNITVRNCRIEQWGMYGVFLLYVSDFRVEHCDLKSIQYAGIMGLSVSDGYIDHNSVDMNFTTGSSSNAYGISLTRLETDSIVTDPKPTDVIVSNNVVENNTLWHGLDCHSSLRCQWIGNRVYNCKDGFHCGASDNVAQVPTWAPTEVTIANNLFDSGVTDGTRVRGIWVTGTATEMATGAITGNRWVGYGPDSASSVAGCSEFYYTSGLLVTGNTWERCSNTSVYLNNNNEGCSIVGNQFIDTWSDLASGSWAIYVNDGANVGAYIADNAFTRGELTGKTHICHTSIFVDSTADSTTVLLGVNRHDSTTPLTGTNKLVNGGFRHGDTDGLQLVGHLGIGSAPTTDELLVRVDQNTNTSVRSENLTNDTNAAAHFLVSSATSSGQFAAYPTNFTAGIGATVADHVGIALNSSAAGAFIGGQVTGQTVRIFSGITAERARFDATGLRMSTSNSAGPYIIPGAGAPEGVVTAPVGSLYMRTDGGVDTTLYTKTSGTGNTGWTAVDNV